ncbi:Histone deacetylase domain protein [uncultured archaeon]|nr:Histone deacetylase domain protein [uncultured archaeon]
MKIIYSPKSVEYSKEGEPEAPFRVSKTYELLKENDPEGKKFEFITPNPCSEEDILRVHSKEFLNAIKSGGKENRELLDNDLVMYDNIFYYASLSAGAAIAAIESCLNDSENVFSLMRPPGHHAGKVAEGFCYFNNMAIAVLKALESGKVKKIAIIDLDLHHGNGTQDIFFGDNRVLFISLHQSPEYPGTGLKSVGNCINFPLSVKTDEKLYLEKLEEAISEIKKFNPDLIGVSAGFDTYKKDPIVEYGNFDLDIKSYEKIAQMIKSVEKPFFSILEGGYSSDVPSLIESYLNGLEK